jgi:signal peptidase
MNWSVPDARTVLRAVVALALVSAVAAFAVFAVPQVVGADHSYVVLSSSMAPAIHAGDAVVVADVPAEKIETGDVITYRTPGDTGEAGVNRVTHRVVEIVEKDGQRHFRTKGDANEEPDSTLVPAENVIGENVLTIPLIGHVVSFADTRFGTLLLVVVPAALLILGELYDFAVAWRAEGEDAGGSDGLGGSDSGGGSDGPADAADGVER